MKKSDISKEFERLSKKTRAHFRKHKITKKIIDEAVKWARQNPSWEEITLPLRTAKKKITEKDVPKLVEKIRNNSLPKFKEFTKESKFTEKDALKLGKKMSRRIAKRLIDHKNRKT